MTTPYARLCLGIPDQTEMDKARLERWKKMSAPRSSIPPKFKEVNDIHVVEPTILVVKKNDIDWVVV
jgi:hypothetical protein